MLSDTEGIVLKTTKTSYGRTMVLLFSRRYGKISAGTNLGERNRGKNSLAIRPFTLGRYELFKGRETYNINSAEVIKSYYRIGENVDKYLLGAYVLEFTEKALAEDVPSQGIFTSLIDFFDLLEKRDKGFGTLVLAYQTKVLKYSGVMPQLDRCVICGSPLTGGLSTEKEESGQADPATKKPGVFSVENGGVVCEDCVQKLPADGLIYPVDFGIIDILKYFAANSLKKLENVGIKEDAGKALQNLIRQYAAYHLGVADINSEKLL